MFLSLSKRSETKWLSRLFRETKNRPSQKRCRYSRSRSFKRNAYQKAQAEKESQAAELQRQTEIAESLKEKELKLATYKQEQDVAKAKADQAYNLESARAQQQVIEQEMQIKIIERQNKSNWKKKKLHVEKSNMIRK